MAHAAGALTALAVLALAACGAGAPRRESGPRHGGSAAIAEGRRLFAVERCGACHALAAVHARGGSGPDLDTSERLDRAQIRTALGEGANGMPSFGGRLTPRQLDALTAFVYTATH